ncbi:hypothetical protein [Caballeronia mineralivorans]|jgi:hypothetical protein|nr:hypothetical protein [Caballeronia mineralivorans]MDB5788179.1 hypothetical protein [Caballeronia mineralivorans]MEA3101155.1 hypothetical protein [Caballeronia mineralivorans]
MLTKTTISEARTAFCLGGNNTPVIHLHAGTQGIGAGAAIVG